MFNRWAVALLVGGFITGGASGAGVTTPPSEPRSDEVARTAPADCIKPADYDKWSPGNKLAWLEKAYVKLMKENESLREKLPPAGPPPSDEVAAAIKSHRLVNGMTIEQANTSLDVKGILDGQGEGGSQRYSWHLVGVVPGQRPVEFYYTADVFNGKITSWSRS